METLEDEDQQSTAKISFPDEIIEQILSRLPVKSILRFRSVCKPWRSIISTPSFTKLHSTVGPCTTALFFTAFDTFTSTRYFFAGANDGRSVANLIKIDNTPYAVGVFEHLNGLVCFTSTTGCYRTTYAYVLNPTTRKFFKLPDPPVYTNNESENMCYLFGFDESSNEHKVLYIDVELMKPTTLEVMIFSISNYSWRKINVDLPIGMSRDRCFYGHGHSVCVNSTIHLMLRSPLEGLAFDLTTETFSIVNFPAHETMLTSVYPHASFVKINGLLGLACYDPLSAEVIEINKVHIWILQDYENRVWVRETVTFPQSMINEGESGPYLLDSVNMDEIIFSPSILSEDLISVPIYNMKTRCFKSIQLTLGFPCPTPKAMHVELILCYVESLIPLQN